MEPERAQGMDGQPSLSSEEILHALYNDHGFIESKSVKDGLGFAQPQCWPDVFMG